MRTTKLELQQALNRANEELVALRAEVSRLRAERAAQPTNKPQSAMAGLMLRARELAKAGRKVRITGGQLYVDGQLSS